jgi:hypothetical protein
MRTNPKLFTLSVILATVLTSSAFAADRGGVQSREDRGLNPFEKIVQIIKRHLPTIKDVIQVPPPAPAIPAP